MKHLKLTFVGLLALTAAASDAFAQGPPGPRRGPRREARQWEARQWEACRVVCAKFSKLVMAGGLAEPGSKLASLCSIGQTHPFVPTCLPAERRAQPRSRLAVGHRRRRRAAVWTAASTVPS